MQTIQLDPAYSTAIANQYRRDIPLSIGQGGIEINTFASGLRLLTIDWQFDHHTRVHDLLQEPCVGFGFCLTGRFESRIDCFESPFTIKGGQSGFYCLPKQVECVEKADKQRMSRILLVLEKDALFRMAKGDDNCFYPVLKKLDKKAPYRIGHSMTPVMKAVSCQMLSCPYHGTTRQLFLEGKAMELLAHKLDQLNPGNGGRESCVESSDVDRVHHAAQLLVHDLENPPDISTLSRRVGLNRNKLHYCFRRTFGLSPFEYLRNQRLQMAMQLLQDGEVTVTQASLQVGYTNLSYFAKAFKSMFGIAPGQLRKS